MLHRARAAVERGSPGAMFSIFSSALNAWPTCANRTPASPLRRGVRQRIGPISRTTKLTGLSSIPRVPSSSQSPLRQRDAFALEDLFRFQAERMGNVDAGRGLKELPTRQGTGIESATARRRTPSRPPGDDPVRQDHGSPELRCGSGLLIPEQDRAEHVAVTRGVPSLESS